ncbi:hypothetical protein N7495_003782 [Penicillium taxi]|uniref:uncharacterized protein n=1 Tax=Penicillium taxi TaxID=168475 RepID=UPI0025450BE9|nr:uncharacterized protein N7495_003782 [Penicillium taxi]KAJ5899038.1 hypothetical protein N7495_003782 [Penicillium taxi]
MLEGRFWGLNESISRSMSNEASLSSASIGGGPLSRLGICTLSSNRSSQYRKYLRLIGIPSSVKFSVASPRAPAVARYRDYQHAHRPCRPLSQEVLQIMVFERR